MTVYFKILVVGQTDAFRQPHNEHSKFCAAHVDGLKEDTVYGLADQSSTSYFRLRRWQALRRRPVVSRRGGRS